MGAHGRSQEGLWKVTILENEREEFQRKVKEAFGIRKMNPELNVNKGVNVLGMRELEKFRTRLKVSKE